MAGRKLRCPAVGELRGRRQPMRMIDQRIAKADPQLRVAGIASDGILKDARPRPRICRSRASASDMTSQLSAGVKLPKKAWRASVSGRPPRASFAWAASAREGRDCPEAHSPRHRASSAAAAALNKPPRTPSSHSAASLSGDQQNEDDPAHQLPRLQADPPANQERADDQQRKRRKPQRPGGRLRGRLVADPAAVALDEPGADRRRLLARGDPAADEVAHVAGELGIGIGDRLALADEAAQLLHQRLRLGFLLGIGKLAVGPISRRQVAVGEQRLRARAKRGAAAKRFIAPAPALQGSSARQTLRSARYAGSG